MNNQEVREAFLSNEEKKSKAAALWREPWFHEYINCALSMMGEYSLSARPDPLPHIQSEHVGGAKGISKFISKLQSIPLEKQQGREDDSEEYIEFIQKPR